MTRRTHLLVALVLLGLAAVVTAGDVPYSPPPNASYPMENMTDYHSPKEDSSYAYYLNQKLYGDFAQYFPPTVYPYLLCVEALDATTYEPYDYDTYAKQSGGYNDEYGGSGYKKPKVLWRAHFGYYSSYKKPYKVCTKCSTGRSYDGYEFYTENGPTEFVQGYSTHFPNSAYHVDFHDGKNNYASWQVKHLTALATTKSQRCPVYKYSRMLYGKAPEIDIPYMKFAYSVNGPWTDNSPFNSKGDGDSHYRDSGYTYFGQFVDHDLTKDPVPGAPTMNDMYDSDSRQYIRKPDWNKWDPYSMRNGRTPHLDLDAVYGKYGRDMNYRDEEDTDKLTEGDGHDMPRWANCTAKVIEMRNNENSLVAQFHYLFIETHNTVVDKIRDNDRKAGCESVAVFERAKRIVTWHYQWLVLNVFLPKIVDADILKHIHTYGRRHYVGMDAQGLHIPIEFSAAAYRLHSMVRPGYFMNDKVGWKKLFDTEHFGSGDDLIGNQCLEKKNLVMDWRRFFTFDCEPFTAIPGKLIDANVARPLLNLPHPPTTGWVVDADPMSLPMRSILRGSMYGIPSGEDYARAWNVRPLTHKQVDWYVDGYYRQDGNYGSNNYNGQSQGYGQSQSYGGQSQSYGNQYNNYNGQSQGYSQSQPDPHASTNGKRSADGYSNSYGQQNNYNGQSQGYNGQSQGYGGQSQGYGQQNSYNGQSQGYGGNGGSYGQKNNYNNYDPYENYEGTPLWFYIQQEAKLHNNGERLGYVGSLIVAETIIGVLQADPDSYLNAAPGFKPFLYKDDDDESSSMYNSYGHGNSYSNGNSYNNGNSYGGSQGNGYGKRDIPKPDTTAEETSGGRGSNPTDRGSAADDSTGPSLTHPIETMIHTSVQGSSQPTNSYQPTNIYQPPAYTGNGNSYSNGNSYGNPKGSSSTPTNAYDSDGKPISSYVQYNTGYCRKRSSYYKIQDLLDFVNLRKPDDGSSTQAS